MLTQHKLIDIQQDDLIGYAESLSDQYSRTFNIAYRKTKGQIFTPGSVSSFMVRLFSINRRIIRLLDPGAGTGMLTAAFCQLLLDKMDMVDLTIEAYENDTSVLPFLNRTLEKCKSTLEGKGHHVKFNISQQDFIIHNKRYVSTPGLFDKFEELNVYDYIVSNPPYFKLNKQSPQSVIMTEVVSGQPNIYSLFMALSAKMLKPEGEMVFITPRSFCSGLYYKKFRGWFLQNMEILAIHSFESRKDVFDKDDILQENVILKARKRKDTKENEHIAVTVSKNKNFDTLFSIQATRDEIIHQNNGEQFIRIPSSLAYSNILNIVNKWSYTLRDLGLEISTGPVVPFRTTPYLLTDITNCDYIPLLWMHNLQGMEIVWPLTKNRKAYAIEVCPATAKLLVPLRNYILMKRFTAKEQKRRLHAAVLLESGLPFHKIGIENHINYIYRPKGCLTVNEAYGIAAIFNSTVADQYFRSLNGNTQVNATEIRNLPLPCIEDINRIGQTVLQERNDNHPCDIDRIVYDILGINTP